RIPDQVDFCLPLSALGSVETLRQKPLQSIQGPVRQDGGDDPPLRCPFRGGEPDVLLQVTCFPPFPQQFLVHGDVLYEPCVADAIKASFDVPFENPGRAPFLAVAPQSEKTVLQGIRTTTFQPKTIGMVVG